MKSFSVLCVCSSLLALSCASSQRVVVMPEYHNRASASGSLVVAPFLPLLLNQRDAEKALGPGDPRQVYLAFMRPRLAAALREHSSFNSVSIDSSMCFSRSDAFQRYLQAIQEPNSTIQELNDAFASYKDALADSTCSDSPSRQETPDSSWSVSLSRRALEWRDEEHLELFLPADGQRVHTRETADWILFIDWLIISRSPGQLGHYVPGPRGAPGGGTWVPLCQDG